MGKNCALGLEYGPRPSASDRTQELRQSFFPIRTSQPANNIYRGYYTVVRKYEFYVQSGRTPDLEEARTMDYVTNHNMITMAMSIIKTLYNNQINARALIGQSAVGYCAGKPTEKSGVF